MTETLASVTQSLIDIDDRDGNDEDAKPAPSGEESDISKAKMLLFNNSQKKTLNQNEIFQNKTILFEKLKHQILESFVKS